jgi:hypothetical protein
MRQDINKTKHFTFKPHLQLESSRPPNQVIRAYMPNMTSWLRNQTTTTAGKNTYGSVSQLHIEDISKGMLHVS